MKYLILALLLTSCATTGEYGCTLTSYGKTEAYFLRADSKCDAHSKIQDLVPDSHDISCKDWL